MMKGYLTVFLSLSLSILTGFILLLTGNAIRNAGKIRLECAADIGMNSVLSEFHIALHERYGLLYVDISYLGREPSIANMENRLVFYLNCNMENDSGHAPWGRVALEDVIITEISTAVKGNGNSMKNQAVKYIQDCGIEREEADVFDHLGIISNLDSRDVMGEWSTLQEQIAGMELPMIINENGEWEEVPLGNPADRIFNLAVSDTFYLLGVDVTGIGIGNIQSKAYISERQVQNMAGDDKNLADNKQFLTYLFEKMGNYRNLKEDSFLQYQLEYIAQGETSDYENLRAVINRLIQWRFAGNVSYAFDMPGMYEETLELAETLPAVQLKPEFTEPVTKSILYSYAYLETIAEVKGLLEGGRIEVEKRNWQTKIEQVILGEIPPGFFGNRGLSYEQYLACMLILLPESTRNLRSMDIMEMDIRYLTGNPYFSMDWCVERCHAQIQADGIFGDQYVLNRTYGYY